VPIVIALFYVATGVAAYALQHNPLWLPFLVERALLLVATPGLQATMPQAVDGPTLARGQWCHVSDSRRATSVPAPARHGGAAAYLPPP
jgi:hypothetical protein